MPDFSPDGFTELVHRTILNYPGGAPTRDELRAAVLDALIADGWDDMAAADQLGAWLDGALSQLLLSDRLHHRVTDGRYVALNPPARVPSSDNTGLCGIVPDDLDAVGPCVRMLGHSERDHVDANGAAWEPGDTDVTDLTVDPALDEWHARQATSIVTDQPTVDLSLEEDRMTFTNVNAAGEVEIIASARIEREPQTEFEKAHHMPGALTQDTVDRITMVRHNLPDGDDESVEEAMRERHGSSKHYGGMGYGWYEGDQFIVDRSRNGQAPVPPAEMVPLELVRQSVAHTLGNEMVSTLGDRGGRIMGSQYTDAIMRCIRDNRGNYDWNEPDPGPVTVAGPEPRDPRLPAGWDVDYDLVDEIVYAELCRIKLAPVHHICDLLKDRDGWSLDVAWVLVPDAIGRLAAARRIMSRDYVSFGSMLGMGMGAMPTPPITVWFIPELPTEAPADITPAAGYVTAPGGQTVTVADHEKLEANREPACTHCGATSNLLRRVDVPDTWQCAQVCADGVERERNLTTLAPVFEPYVDGLAEQAQAIIDDVVEQTGVQLEWVDPPAAAPRALLQIRRLGQYIEDNVPGEPSKSEGAVDCAIRLLSVGADPDLPDPKPTLQDWETLSRRLGRKGTWAEMKLMLNGFPTPDVTEPAAEPWS